MSACTWCANGRRRAEVPAGHVILFACVREHMTAYPLCADCADSACLGAAYRCKECAATGLGEDAAVCTVELVTSREDWMRRVESGQVRMLRRTAS